MNHHTERIHWRPCWRAWRPCFGRRPLYRRMAIARPHLCPDPQWRCSRELSWRPEQGKCSINWNKIASGLIHIILEKFLPVTPVSNTELIWLYALILLVNKSSVYSFLSGQNENKRNMQNHYQLDWRWQYFIKTCVFNPSLTRIWVN